MTGPLSGVKGSYPGSGTVKRRRISSSAVIQNATTIDETGYRYLPVTGVSGFTLGRLEDKHSWTGAERANADVMSGSGLRTADRPT